MSKGLLIKDMMVEYSVNFNRDNKVLYLECFGRLMDGKALGYHYQLIILRKEKSVKF